MPTCMHGSQKLTYLRASLASQLLSYSFCGVGEQEVFKKSGLKKDWGDHQAAPKEQD